MGKPRSMLLARSKVMLLVDVALVNVLGSCTDEPFSGTASVELTARLVVPATTS
jgi:hypothetical protein